MTNAVNAIRLRFAPEGIIHWLATNIIVIQNVGSARGL